MSERHCDPVTLDHLIGLQKRLAEQERFITNALDKCAALQSQVWSMRMKLLKHKSDEYERIDQMERALQQILWSTKDPVSKQIADEALEGCSDGGRNEGKQNGKTREP